MSSAVSASCMICGDRATKLRYSHYGATSCFSCRAFFRRAVEKNSHFNYACKSRDCAVTVATRKKCPYCRYQKCKVVGMSHSSPGGGNHTGSSSGKNNNNNNNNSNSNNNNSIINARLASKDDKCHKSDEVRRICDRTDQCPQSYSNKDYYYFQYLDCGHLQ